VHRFQRTLAGLDGRIDTPAPVVVVDALQRNIDRMQGFADAHGVALRPHVKTHKSVEIGRRQLAAGAVGITAGNVGEAEVFAAAGFTDVFIAYPVWPSGTKAARLRSLARRIRLRVGVDDPAAVAALADAMGDEPERLEVVVEIDCGGRRSGTSPDLAGELAREARARGLLPVGVFTYPGHGGSAVEARERAARDQHDALETAVRSLEAAGLAPHVVSAGSTPTAAYSTGGVVTEIRPGEYVFGDLDNTRLGACAEEDVALFVASTVVSRQVPRQAILDVGTKALGREGNPQKGYGAVAGGDAVLTRLNEYHGFLAVEGEAPAVGTVLPLVPNHVCPVVASFEELVATDADGSTIERWPVDARGRLS